MLGRVLTRAIVRAKRYAVDAHTVPLQPFEITFVTMAQTP
jgi:hypothetical protein